MHRDRCAIPDPHSGPHAFRLAPGCGGRSCGAILTTALLVGIMGWTADGQDGRGNAMTDGTGSGATSRTALPEASRFSACPEEIRSEQRPVRRILVDAPDSHAPGTPSPAWTVQRVPGGVRFQIAGRAGSLRAMTWRAPMRLEAAPPFRYFLLRYKAAHLARSTSASPVLQMKGSHGGQQVSRVLLDAGEVRNDAREHRVAGRIEPLDKCSELQVHLATRDSGAWLEVRELVLSADPPAPAVYLADPREIDPAAVGPFVPLPLDGRFNDSCTRVFEHLLNEKGMVIDGTVLPGGELRTGSVPFRIHSGRSNIIRPPEDPTVNDQPAEFAGVRTTRKYYEPIGRDDVVEIPVGRKVSEVFLLLVAELPASFRGYAGPKRPFVLDDVGALLVELDYAAGPPDLAFPYSLADGGFVVQRMLGAYAVAADPARELRSVRLHNRVFGITVSVAAVTVNTGSVRAAPGAAADPAPVVPRAAASPVRRAPYVERRGDRIQLGNTYYSVVLNCSRGLSIERLENRWSRTEWAVDSRSGVEVVSSDRVFTGRAFRTADVRIGKRDVTIVLHGPVPDLPLVLTATFQVDESPELQAQLTVQNAGDHPIAPEIIFPAVRGLRMGRAGDVWVFFPQYRTVVTNRYGTWRSPNDLTFPTQVFDVWAPRAGAGLGWLTRNRENAVLDYTAALSERGADAGIAYPGPFHRLGPGEKQRLPRTVLLFHKGDWHEAFHAYRKWLATWFRPVEAQDKPWFQRIFLSRSHQTKKFYSWAIPIYDAETRTYRIDDFVKGDAAYLHMYPQIVHLFGWIDLEKGWHGHPMGDYDLAACTGGIDALRNAVQRLQEHFHIPASLYTISDRVHKDSRFGKRFGAKIARRREDGSLVQDEANWYICPCSTRWHKHYAESLKRVQAATGVRVLYVDVFGYARNSACYSPEHGHAVPADPNQGCLMLLQELREALPEGVALWSEYPVNDVAMQYLDGNIHYYCLYWHEHFSKNYDRIESARSAAPAPLNICRYAFPRVKQFVFLCGSQNWSSDSKFPFFNGEALYDTSWFLYASPHLDRIRKSLAIQVRYADCFTSDAPEPRIPTLKGEVYANRFPGRTRTVWTLYNARYTSVRGPVLAVPHEEGAMYRDVWNDQPLKPRVENGKAVISLALPPQGLGCVVQERASQPHPSEHPPVER